MHAPKNNIAPGLVRGLGVWTATAIVIGAMIGQSVFLVASDMSREVGSMTKVLAVWLVGGVVVLFGVFALRNWVRPCRKPEATIFTWAAELVQSGDFSLGGPAR